MTAPCKRWAPSTWKEYLSRLDHSRCVPDQMADCGAFVRFRSFRLASKPLLICTPRVWTKLTGPSFRRVLQFLNGQTVRSSSLLELVFPLSFQQVNRSTLAGVCGYGYAARFQTRCWFNNDPLGRYICCDSAACNGFAAPDYFTPVCKNKGYNPPGYGVNGLLPLGSATPPPQTPAPTTNPPQTPSPTTNPPSPANTPGKYRKMLPVSQAHWQLEAGLCGERILLSFKLVLWEKNRELEAKSFSFGDFLLASRRLCHRIDRGCSKAQEERRRGGATLFLFGGPMSPLLLCYLSPPFREGRVTGTGLVLPRSLDSIIGGRMYTE